jgi:hydroxyacylglutathione hydrolase
LEGYALVVERMVVGPLLTNCYLVWDEEGNGIIIDPGDEPDRIWSSVEEKGISVRAIVITHAHVDHMAAAGVLCRRADLPLSMHRDEEWLLSSYSEQALAFLGMEEIPPPPEDISFLKDGDLIKAGSISLLVIHSPGHSPGSICLSYEDILFSGDLIFRGSVGRTDLPGGDMGQLMISIRRILSLPRNTIIYPGHGPQTTLELEIATNPFLL